MSHVAGQRVLGGRFELERQLGGGGMGTVWAAVEASTSRRFALKFLREEMRNDALAKRFVREARSTMAVKHPNVVTIHEVMADELGVPVIAMELLQGESLDACLKRCVRLSLPVAARILADVCAGVRAAHAVGLVHRDLKPENIFLVEGPDGCRQVRVLDFGIAKRVDGDELAKTESLTMTGALLGTPHYMSPEQAFGEKDVDRRADVYAMGVIAFECLTGRRPLEADNFGQLMRMLLNDRVTKLSEAAPELPRDVRDVVDRALSGDRTQRPADLEDMQAVLQRHAADAVRLLDLEASAERRVEITPRPDHRAHPLDHTLPAREATTSSAATTLDPSRRKSAIALGSVLVLAAIGAAIALLLALSAPPRARPAPRAAEDSNLNGTVVSIAQVPSASEPPMPVTSASSAQALAPPAIARRHEPAKAPSASASTTPSTTSSVQRLQGGIAAESPF